MKYEMEYMQTDANIAKFNRYKKKARSKTKFADRSYNKFYDNRKINGDLRRDRLMNVFSLSLNRNKKY